MTKGNFSIHFLNENFDDFTESVNYTNLDVLFISSMNLLAGEEK